MTSDEKRFFQADLTTNLFVWLKLSQSIDQAIEQSRSDSSDTLANKVDEMFAEPTLISHIGLILGLVGLMFGFIAVSGIVGYSNTQPANIWFVLALFAGWPLLTAILSFLIDSRRPSVILQSLLSWVKRSPQFPLSATSSNAHTQLILKWLSWRWQLFSIGFVGGSLIGFFVIIAFWDVSFGWSSTLANSQQWMEPLINTVTWPGHWLLGSPPLELINVSSLTRYSPTQDAVLLRQWWPYVLFCIFLYGLVSRLLLLLWKHYRLKLAIIGDIRTTRVIERFKSKRAERTSVFTPLDEVNVDSAHLLTGDTADLSRQLLFGWQFNHPTLKTNYNFGVKAWQADLAWLAQYHSPEVESEALILVDIHQTPVIELIDLVEHIQKTKPSWAVNLGVFVSCDNLHNQSRFDATWQQFAKKHHQLTFTRYTETKR